MITLPQSIRRWLVISLLAALGTNVHAIAPRLRSGEETSFAIPRISTPPKIDGVIDPVEWREAVAIGGVVDQSTDILDSRPATFFLAWDADHLYMACRVYMRAGYKFRVYGGRMPGGANCSDDGLELLFKPLGKNVDRLNRATEFKLNVSGLGQGGTYTRLAVGQIMANWDPKMKSAYHVTAPGTAPEGGCWWEMETVYSTKDFELTGPNQVGDQWKMMLGINQFPGGIQERIPCVDGYFTPNGKCVATLVENTPAVQMNMDSLANLATDGTAKLGIKVFNPAQTAKPVQVAVDVAGKIVKTETLDLPAGGEKSFQLNEKLPADIKDGRVALRVTDGQQTLLTYQANFQVGLYNARIQPVAAPNPNEFPFTASFNPVRGLLQIHADSYLLPAPDEVKSLKYEVKHKESGKVAAAGAIPQAVYWNYDEILTLKDPAPGHYETTAQFVLKDGQTFGPRAGTFEKKDEAKAFPAWWDKDIGNVDRVLPPFTAVEQKGDRLSCWGRSYQLSSLGLPVEVKSQNGEIMAAPARVVVKVAGKETVIKLGKPTITDVKDWRVRFTGKAEGAGLAFRAEGWMEQDGLVSVELTYQPKAGKPVQVEALRIEYPVATEAAECLVSVVMGMNFAPLTARVLPKDKQGTLWSVFEPGRGGAQMQVGSFYPHVWLGSEQRGFQWWADSDRGWFPADDVPAHEVVREGKAVVLKNNIIGKPVTVTEARTLRFTWNATPFKALPKGWRMIAATDDGTFFVPHRGLRDNPKTGQKYCNPGAGNVNYINPESDNPAEWSALWAQQKTNGFGGFAAADQVVHDRRPFDLYYARTGVSWQHMSFQVIGYGHKSMEDSVFDYFGEEWYGGSGDSWNESYIDYAMWLMDRAFREGGVVSTYWDLAFPILSANPLSGLAYRLPDGRFQPGYNTLNCRNFYQHLWAVQDKDGLNPGAVGCHSTHAYIFPAMPWLDAVLDGERGFNLETSDKDWMDDYPSERMRSLSCPHNWGVGICWMSIFDSPDARKIAKAKTSQGEYVFMHDSWLNPYLAPAYQVTRMPAPILDWGLNEADVTYHPYWRDPFVASQDKDVLVSLWQIPGEAEGRVLVGVFNYDRKATKDIEVKLDLAALKLQGKALVMRDLYKNFSEAEVDSPDPNVTAALTYSNPGLGAAAEFDPGTGILRIQGLAPHRGRYVGVGAIDPTALADAKKHLPAPITEVPAGVSDFGLINKNVKYLAAGNIPTVTCGDPSIQVGLWQLPDRVLVVVKNATAATARDAVIKIDLEQLGLTPQLPWQEFIGVRDLNSGDKAASSALDYYGRTLTVKAVAPGTSRLIGIRKY